MGGRGWEGGGRQGEGGRWGGGGGGIHHINIPPALARTAARSPAKDYDHHIFNTSTSPFELFSSTEQWWIRFSVFSDRT